ncbi:virB8 family protein [Luteibacter yeojuensis]|uniref:Type IV secretion system protein n=1 Tax=Luteibacter yeojuensis TaxID=345309 RepID=A0A7X5QRI2_9GAMM|nr:type IV secretion system protein [Luteibacter yeojuensis]NID13977.1 type IV secretion system protein [Luteibacter yeojuensis]
MLNKKQSPKIDAAVAKSVDFEITISDLAQRSERRAWMVAFCAISLSLILAGGYFYMLPLKEKVPYIVLADAYTGMSSVTRITDDVVNRRITASEAINRSNVTHFILARESFDVTMINLRDWATVLTMAAPKVAKGYTDLHSLDNPDAPYKTYGRDRAIRVKISSIIFIGGDNGTTPKGATVRFQRSVYNKLSGQTVPLDNKIATLAFSYKPNLKMDDQYRVENPLGFQVTDYRVDSDYAEPPPPESEAPAATQAPAAAPGPAQQPPASLEALPQSPIPVDNAPAAGMPAQTAAPQSVATVQPNAANGGRRR